MTSVIAFGALLACKRLACKSSFDKSVAVLDSR